MWIWWLHTWTCSKLVPGICRIMLCCGAGQCQKPILLKRGLAGTIEEWLLSAEYIMSAGNPKVVLCERGSAHLRLLAQYAGYQCGAHN